MNCNSDGDVIAETLLGLFLRLSTTVRRGGGANALRAHGDLSEFLYETPKLAVNGLSFDTISEHFIKYILDLVAGNPKRDL